MLNMKLVNGELKILANALFLSETCLLYDVYWNSTTNHRCAFSENVNGRSRSNPGSHHRLSSSDPIVSNR